MSHNHRNNPQLCDCGAPGWHYDGGGWTCKRCAELTSMANARIDDLIFERRRAEQPHDVWLEQQRNQRRAQQKWASRNRLRANENVNLWKRKNLCRPSQAL